MKLDLNTPESERGSHLPDEEDVVSIEEHVTPVCSRWGALPGRGVRQRVF
jgi:hypothetical protein